MSTEQSTPTPPFSHHRALVLVRQRLNEADAIAGVPLNIQADLEHLLVEAIDLPATRALSEASG